MYTLCHYFYLTNMCKKLPKKKSEPSQKKDMFVVASRDPFNKKKNGKLEMRKNKK